MPKIISDSHDAMMKRYFETSEDKVIGLERVIFPNNKNGYLIPCSLMIKVLPNLDDGIKIVGFLKSIDNSSQLNKGDYEAIDQEEQVSDVKGLG